MFGFSEDDDLFGAKSKPAPQQRAGAQATAAPTVDLATVTTGTNGSMSAKKRLRRFNQLYRWVGDRIGAKPVLVKFPEQVRDTVWQQMFQLATTKKQLEAIVTLFPKWRDSKRKFSDKMSDAFVRKCGCVIVCAFTQRLPPVRTGRCEELHCPTLALSVYADHPKYGVDLTEQGARRLLHSLHVEHPLNDSVLLMALRNVYNLPPISNDLVSCAMFVSACFKAGTPESLVIARALIPPLQTLLKKVSPRSLKYPPRGQRTQAADREKVWLTWTLTKIEKALKTQGEEWKWLRQWRQRSEHVQVAT